MIDLCLHSLHCSSPQLYEIVIIMPILLAQGLSDVGTQCWQTQKLSPQYHSFPQCNGKVWLIITMVSYRCVYHLTQSSQTTLRIWLCHHLEIKKWGWPEVKWLVKKWWKFPKWKITVSWSRLRRLYGGREIGVDSWRQSKIW